MGFHVLDRSNPINSNLRIQMLRSNITRSLFMLNEYGDNRLAYLTPNSNTVLVEVDFQKGKDPDRSTEAWIKTTIEELMGKNVEIMVIQDKEIPDLKEFSEFELKEAITKSQTYFPKENQDYIHILYVSKLTPYPSNNGMAMDATSIAIFQSVIQNEDLKRETIRDIEEATLKHEIGHLLGLEHIADDRCIMSENVEILGSYVQQSGEEKVKFCGESLVELDKFKELVL